MAPRYNRARLITAEDRYYRQFLERIMLARENQRAMRPPRQRDLFGSEAEQALRGWLSQRHELSDRRILEYEERRGHSWIRKYRELDAVILEGRTIYVFEIKASRTAGTLLRAVQQLEETRQILSLLFQRIITTVLFVDTGVLTAEDVAALMASPEAPSRPPLTMAQVLEAEPALHPVASLDEVRDESGVIHMLLFGVQDIIDMAGAENLHLNWEEDEESEEQPTEQQPAEDLQEETPVGETEEEESAFAAAFRKAMEQRSKSK